MTNQIEKIKDLRVQTGFTKSVLATISSKTEIRMFRNGNGKLFEIEMYDGTSIKMVFFGNEADKFYNRIEQGKTYIIKGFNIVPANKQYDPKHIYQLRCTQNTEITHSDSEAFQSNGEIQDVPKQVDGLVARFEEMTLKEGIDKYDQSKQPVYIRVGGEIVDIDYRGIYNSCPTKNCSRKVTKQDEKYICRYCGNFQTCEINFLFRIAINFGGEHYWCTSFDESTKKLLKDIDLVAAYNNKQDEFDAIVKTLIGKTMEFNVKISKNQSFGNNIQMIIENAKEFVAVNESKHVFSNDSQNTPQTTIPPSGSKDNDDSNNETDAKESPKQVLLANSSKNDALNNNIGNKTSSRQASMKRSTKKSEDDNTANEPSNRRESLRNSAKHSNLNDSMITNEPPNRRASLKRSTKNSEDDNIASEPLNRRESLKRSAKHSDLNDNMITSEPSKYEAKTSKAKRRR